MTWSASSNTRFFPLRWLAILALLCVVTLQVAEAAHHHGLGDSAAHCVLCKSSGNAVAVAAPPSLPQLITVAFILVLFPRGSLSRACYLPRLTRGPPVLLN